MKTNAGQQMNDSDFNKPDNWVGVFYFNRKDSRLIVPKRIEGLGWTINFANPYTYVLLIAIVAIIISFNYFVK